jgi:hypothetical protein
MTLRQVATAPEAPKSTMSGRGGLSRPDTNKIWLELDLEKLQTFYVG